MKSSSSPRRKAANPAPSPPPRPTIGIALPLDSAKRRDLKARAHGLEPVVMVSAKGVTPGVTAEVERALDHHELIKIRVLGDDRGERDALLDALCAGTGAAPVQHIGKILIIYRPRPAT